MTNHNDNIHMTSKDQEVKKEIKEIKIFLLKSGLAMLFTLLLIVVIVAAISYYFWDHGALLSKFQLSVILGISTFFYVLYYFLRPIFMVFEKPKGIKLSSDTPLYEIVNDLAIKLNSPAIEQIFLVSDLNAYVSSYRTWKNLTKKHYLSIGIQLLSTISIEEVKSIIAHELGHISKDHSDFSTFIYRVYIGLHHLECEYLRQGGDAEDLANGPYMKFVKKLDEMSYSTKRNNEFQADEIAAKITTAKTTASALARIYYIADWLDEQYWDKVWKNSWKYPAPQNGVIISACKKIMGCSTSNLSGYFDKVKITKTKKGDTHPSLKDRVDHLDVELKLPDKIEQKNLAIFSLGKKLKEYMEICDKDWQENNLHEWQSYHEYMSNSIMRRDLLVKTKAIRPLLNGEYFELARLEEIVGATSKAIKIYYETYQREKGNISSLYEAARLMLKINSAKAESIINKLMHRCPIIKYRGAELLANHYDRLNDSIKSKEFEIIKDEADKILSIRDSAPKKNIMPHGLSEKEIKEVVNWLKHFGGIYWAMLFQMKPKKGGMRNYPNYILIVCTDSYLYDGSGNRLMDGFHLNGTLKLIDDEYDEDSLADYIADNYKAGIIVGASEFE